MSRAVRWQFALPWLALLVAVLVVAQFVLARIVGMTIDKAGEEKVGAKVDVGATHVSFLGSRVSFDGLAVANPQAPMRNLLEAEHCELHFEPAAFLYKQAVVDRGTVSGIRIGTPRTTSGALECGGRDAAGAANWFDEESAAAAEAWLDQLEQTFTADWMSQLESIRLTEQLLVRLPDEHAALEERLAKLRERTTKFTESVRQAKTNPLRHVEFMENVPATIMDIQDGLTKLGDDIENLPNMLDEDRRAIVAARQHDEELLREQLKFKPIDRNALTAYLLQQQMAGPLGDLVGWMRWIRRMMPAEPRNVAHHRRGQDVYFPGCNRSPGLLVRSLDLQGTAEFGGRPVTLLGTVTDYADKPRLHDQPLRVRLTTGDGLPLEVRATVDRTGPLARDQLLVNCGGIVLPKLHLGGSKLLGLSLEPAEATLNVSITLEGDRLSGDIQLVQKQVKVSPELPEEVSGVGLATALTESLGCINSVATRISLRGTLDEPECQIWSNLGPAVAEAMDRALVRTADSFSRQLVTQSQQRVDERLAEMDRKIGELQAGLYPQLSDSNVAIAAVAEGRDRPVRVSLEHLGRQLPAESLFR